MMTFHGKHAMLCVLFFMVWMIYETTLLWSTKHRSFIKNKFAYVSVFDSDGVFEEALLKHLSLKGSPRDQSVT